MRTFKYERLSGPPHSEYRVRRFGVVLGRVRRDHGDQGWRWLAHRDSDSRVIGSYSKRKVAAFALHARRVEAAVGLLRGMTRAQLAVIGQDIIRAGEIVERWETASLLSAQPFVLRDDGESG